MFDPSTFVFISSARAPKVCPQSFCPSVVSIRNSTIIQHFDTSCIDFDRKGNVNALKQNLDSPYKEKISDLSKSAGRQVIGSAPSRTLACSSVSTSAGA